jgi:diguanylate cyclase (GGDEF)-like protein
MLQARHGADLSRVLARAADLAREGRAAEVRTLAGTLEAGSSPVPLDDRVLLGTLLGLAHANAQEFAAAKAALDAVSPLVSAAVPGRQARFHSVAGWVAHGGGDKEAAMEAVVRALALAEARPLESCGEDIRAALGNCSLVLCLLHLCPLAAEVAEKAVAVAAERGLPAGPSEFQVGFVYYTCALRLDHLGLAERSSRLWAQAEAHFGTALASDTLSVLFRAWAAAWRTVCAVRLGRVEQGRADLALARRLPVHPPNSSVQRSIGLAEGALLLAEGRIREAEAVLQPLWTSFERVSTSPFIEEVAALLGKAAAARGDGAAALRWFQELHERYGRAQYDAWLSRATAARLRTEQEALLRRTRQLESDVLSDPLTGVPNRRAFDANLPRLVAAAHAGGTSLSLGIVDVDRFKRVNDTFGHPVGDEVLRRVAQILRSHAPDADSCARYGGDELTLCLPVSGAGAVVVLDRITRLVASHPWSAVASGLMVTVSVGVAELGPDDTAATLLWAADQSLLEAKRARPPARPRPPDLDGQGPPARAPVYER